MDSMNLIALTSAVALTVIVTVGLAAVFLRSYLAAQAKNQTELLLGSAKAHFGDLSLTALSRATEQLSSMSQTHMQQARSASAQDLDTRKLLIDQHLSRMSDQMKSVSELMRTLEKDRESKFGELSSRLTSAGEQTAALIQVTSGLREALASSQARGQWGERMAEDILRLAGFIENINYQKQKIISGSGAKPDFTFLLPNNQVLNMDVKFPVANYLRYIEAQLPSDKDRARRDFLIDVRARIREIAGRDYINSSQNTVDCVLLFIPHEQVFAFIQGEDPAIMDEALRNKVVCCSPMTLFAVLAVVRQAVDHFSMERRSVEMLGHLGEFKKQWEKFSEKFDALGGRIDSLQKDYEALVSTRRRLLEKPLEKLDQLRIAADAPAMTAAAIAGIQNTDNGTGSDPIPNLVGATIG